MCGEPLKDWVTAMCGEPLALTCTWLGHCHVWRTFKRLGHCHMWGALSTDLHMVGSPSFVPLTSSSLNSETKGLTVFGITTCGKCPLLSD